MKWMYSALRFSLIVSLLFVMATVVVKKSEAAEVTGKSLVIVLDQTYITSPAVLSVDIENNNPERYMVVFPDNFIVVKLLDSTDSVLYEGQVKRTNYELPNMDVEVIDNPLVINFPYFEESAKVVIFDESNVEILAIDLDQYSILPTPTGANRTVRCNACGYCVDKDPPGNLDACMACLYPDLEIIQTLAINPPDTKPPSPRVGAYYTQLGCIDVGIAGFQDASAGGGVVNAILTRLLFPITGVLSLLSLIYGAFLVMTAQGNADQIQSGKKWIYGAIVGVIFTFITIFLIRIIAGDILRIPGFDI